jgi:ribonuclease HI
MENENISWKRMIFKKNKVWVAVSPEGEPFQKNGKVLIKYSPDQDYEYWVNESNVKEIRPEIQAGKTALKKIKRGKETAGEKADIPSDAILIHTDGASSGNPGPSGIGIVFRFGEHEREISKHIGNATNNIAELEAIRTALLELKTVKKPVRIFTDSSYAYGVLTMNWKPKKNIELIKIIKKTMTSFSDLKLVKVKGHAGHPDNERADALATGALKSSI